MNNKLQSGKPYSLETIFSGENNKVIIPDLQRDYCWGNPLSEDNSDTLVKSFLDTIFELEPHWDKDITMGLIYGYYDELTSYHLQLCDGQQRLTTLFLLLGVVNRRLDNHPYRKILVSDFELNRDDKEPHLLYSIRESSLYFLSDLTVEYFMKQSFPVEDIEKQSWFLNSYNVDPTIQSIIRAIKTIENRLDAYNAERLRKLGDFLIKRIKFLFYDMVDRKNGEETFVVINTTGEPLSAAQNLKPKIIKADINKDYKHISEDWEEMETWFWKNRRRNGIDTSTEGMQAFLHCVRVLECETVAEWYENIEINNDKFDINIPMQSIWEWFEAYKRIYESDFSRLETPKVEYSEKQSHNAQNYYHYTQKELYSLLPTMVYCKKFPHATENDLQRVYHLFYNMSKYRTTTRSSEQNGYKNVPQFRLCKMVEQLETKDILSFLDISTFEVEEEKTKLTFLTTYQNEESVRRHIEEIFAKAENFRIFDGQIATMVKWSELSLDKLEFFYNRIQELWIAPDNLNKLRRALLAWGVKGYPMSTGTANKTLCSNTEWRELFEKRDEQIKSFICNGQLDDIIANHKDETSPFYLLIHDEEYLDFSKDHNIRIHPQGVIELMAKTYASANFLLFHNGVVFEKEMVDMQNWNGFWVWSDGEISVFYSICLRLDITLDMQIKEKGYQIVGWCNRRPDKPSVPIDKLVALGFVQNEDAWCYPIIESPFEAKAKFIELTQEITNTK